jgi:hypothetical protein
VMGAGSPREVDTPTPVAKSRRGGRGAGARGGHGSTRHRRSVEGTTRAAESPARAAEAYRSAAVAATGATAASAGPSRKRKRRFSTLR